MPDRTVHPKCIGTYLSQYAVSRGTCFWGSNNFSLLQRRSAELEAPTAVPILFGPHGNKLMPRKGHIHGRSSYILGLLLTVAMEALMY